MMQWLIIKSNDIGADYGVGSFIDQFIKGMRESNACRIFLLEINNETISEFYFEKSLNFTHFKLPKNKWIKFRDTEMNHLRFARSITKVIYPFINQNERIIIHINYIFEYYIAYEFKKKFNCEIYFTLHLISKDISRDFLQLEQKALSIADKIIVVTDCGKEYLLSKGIDKTKIKIIRNGISTNLFTINDSINILSKYDLKYDINYIIFSGRISIQKGIILLMKTFELLLKKSIKVNLIIAGDGDFKTMINLSKNFSSHINYLGYIPQTDLIYLYKHTKIGIIPSLEEQCSYVALEMLHSGLPVVASKVGGLKEIFTHKEDALLIDIFYNNELKIAESFANSIYSLLTNKTLREKLSKNSQIKAKKYFTQQRMINEYLST